MMINNTIDDAKSGVLHSNKHMRKDNLGKAAMTSAHTAACEALSAHEAVESEVEDEQEDGARDDENIVERELLQQYSSYSPQCSSRWTGLLGVPSPRASMVGVGAGPFIAFLSFFP